VVHTKSAGRSFFPRQVVAASLLLALLAQGMPLVVFLPQRARGPVFSGCCLVEAVSRLCYSLRLSSCFQEKGHDGFLRVGIPGPDDCGVSPGVAGKPGCSLVLIPGKDEAGASCKSNKACRCVTKKPGSLARSGSASRLLKRKQENPK
jgi:hypothetical protein